MSRALKELQMDTYSGRFAARLRELRLATGLTGQQMSQALRDAGYESSQRAYYNWEAGDHSPPIDALPYLAELFGLSSPRELFPQK